LSDNLLAYLMFDLALVQMVNKVWIPTWLCCMIVHVSVLMFFALSRKLAWLTN